MTSIIVSATAFADGETRRGITRSDRTRQAILNKCYALPGYDALPLDEKNQLYDRMKQARQREILRGMKKKTLLDFYVDTIIKYE